ncbi:MAG: two-component system, chemotaxis family, CheB/CheR fusion protein [Chthoniobacter sp.]|nr:two-component system, chemotaxis family, CheB/CheR fusion protein [Chthoniobacter sp.]
MFSHLTEGRFKPLDISIAVFLAGCAPAILMALVAYSILSRTLEDKIVVDRHTLVESLAGQIGSDIRRTADVVEYYQNLPLTQRMVLRPFRDASAEDWLAETFYSHPQIDGMFLTDPAGKLIASIPATSASSGQDFASKEWLPGARQASGAFISGLHLRASDHRPAAALVAAVRAQSGEVVGYVGSTVLVERIGKRLAGLNYGEQTRVQVLVQNGRRFFGENFLPNDSTEAPDTAFLKALKDAHDHLKIDKTFVSFGSIEPTPWTAIIEQPLAVAYKPVHDLVTKMSLIGGWLIIGSIAAAWLVSRLYTKQFEANRRVARETFFNEKILANMPLGIALVDPVDKKFLQANQSFLELAQTIGGVPPERDLADLRATEVHLGVDEVIDRVATTGAPFQAREQKVTARDGVTHFLTINLLRLQDAEHRMHGILFLIADNTAEISIRKELIAANTAKDEFLALLSHELRNPLSPVITMVHELEKIAPADPLVQKALEVIRRNVELEARLIDDLLDITRISHGKLQLTPEVVNAHRAIHRAIEICQKEIEAKKLAVEVRLEASDHHVKADPARFQQVLWNLIKNAVKFTERGSITITSHNVGRQRIVIEVADTGIGIEPERLTKIFKAFEQGESAITRRFGGLGLGLAISKAMVEAHGGKLSVRSHGPGLGATFCVEFDTVDAATTAENHERHPTLAGGPTQHKILLVDDHEDTCIGMKMLLDRRGYRVKTANSVAQALELAGREEFELLISDLGLPDGTGFELMEKIRALGSGVRGVALSGFGMESDIEHSQRAGFSDHLIKPVNIERLDAILRKMFPD